MKRKYIPLLILLLMATNVFAEDEATSQAVNVPPIISKINSLEKKFKWDSTTTKNFVLNSILLCPEVYQDYAISEFETIIAKKLVGSNNMIATRKIVIQTIEEMVPESQLDNVKETIGITRKSKTYMDPRLESTLNAMKKK